VMKEYVGKVKGSKARRGEKGRNAKGGIGL
jgi:hypothetical protein